MQSLDRLESLGMRGIKLGLGAIDSVCARLGRPENAVPSVLVAGTNGKGSTAATLTSIAAASGRRCGLYTSPHLLSVCERVRIGPDDVAPEALDAALARVFEAADRAPAIPLTYFESVTAAAFVLFQEARLDAAILEVGMGGRFDATNIAPARVSVVTSIGLDHMAELGATLPQIAGEKAGVFRQGRPVLVRAEDASARAALEEAAWAAGAVFHDAHREIAIGRVRVDVHGTEFEVETARRKAVLWTPLPGAHQAWNAALAVRTAELWPEGFGELDAETFARGVAGVRWAGRLERLAGPGGRAVLLDGCHNPDGARALARFLDDAGLSGRVTLVFGAMADKDIEGIAAEIFPKAADVILVAAAPPRGATPEELLRRVGALAHRVRTAPDAALALESLAAPAETRDGERSAPIIVAGSLYLVGEARAHLLAASRGAGTAGERSGKGHP